MSTARIPFNVLIIILLSLSESEVLNGDIYGMIVPYATANLLVF